MIYDHFNKEHDEVVLVFSDIRVTLDLYKTLLLTEDLPLDVEFVSPSKYYSSNSNTYDIFDEWNHLATDIFEDTLVSFP